MKTSRFRRLLSAALAMVMVLSCVQSLASASDQGGLPERSYQYFTDAGASEETRAREAFYFGSTNLTVSEKSSDSYLLKICRGGEAAEEAAVTVKFGDYSAVYGENYTVALYHDDGELTITGNQFSMVQFMTENADSYTEMTEEEEAQAEEELMNQLTTQDSTDIYDLNGSLISTMRVSETEDEDGETGYDAEAEDQAQSNDLDTNQSDYTTAAQVRLTFAPGETEKYIVIKPKYSREAQGDARVEITLDNPSDGMYLPDEDFVTVLTIQDEDEAEPAVLNLTDSVLSADGDTITLTVTRDGAINDLVGAQLTTAEISAEQGDDFQGVNAMLYFPMGVTERTVTLKLNHRYKEKSTQFTLNLSSPVGATLENDSCLITILPDEDLEDDVALDGEAAAVDSEDDASLQSYANNVIYGQESDLNFNTYGYSVQNKAGVYWGGTTFWADNRGLSDNTWCGVRFNLPSYYYCGMAVQWSVGRKSGCTTYGLGRISYTDKDGNTYLNIYNNDCGPFSNSWDAGFFNKPGITSGYVGIVTTKYSGKYMDVQHVRMTRMQYTVNLVQPDSLDFVGVSTAEEDTYVATYISGESSTTKSKTIYAGDSITLTGSTAGGQYVTLTGLEITDEKGNVLYKNKNSAVWSETLADQEKRRCSIANLDADAAVYQNGTSVTLTLTADLLSAVGLKLEELGYYTQDGDGRYSGKIYIKPIYSYKDATVVLKSLKKGTGSAYFDGYQDATITMHVGDVISFTRYGSTGKDDTGFTLATTVEDTNYHSVGYDAARYVSADTGTVSDNSPGARYSNGTASLKLTTARTVIYPRVDNVNNRVVVRVKKTLVDSGSFDTTQGIFTYQYTDGGDYYVYNLSDDEESIVADELYSAVAIPGDESMVCNWTRGSESDVYSGNVMYLFSSNEPEDNVLTLTLAKNAVSCTVEGTVCNDNTVLDTAGKTAVLLPASGAAITAGSADAAASADQETGAFRLTGVVASPGTKVPMLVYYNNSANIRYIDIPETGTQVNLATINLSTNNGDTAYVDHVYFTLGGQKLTDGYGVVMDGSTLVMSADVVDGKSYTITQDGKQVTKKEKVTGVNFYVLDGTTYAVKGTYAAAKGSGNTWSASILKFNPEVPEEYTSGDLFYVQIVTDRVSGVLESGVTPETAYAPVATAYGVAAGGDYTTETVSFNVPFSADDLMGDDSLQGAKSFVKLPLLGNMDLLSYFKGPISVKSLGSDPIDPVSQSNKASLRITVYTETLEDGRLRVHFGVVLSKGNQKFYQSDDPAGSIDTAYSYAAAVRLQHMGLNPDGSKTTGLNKDALGAVDIEDQRHDMRTQVSGLQLSISMSVGLYLDFVLTSDSGEALDISNMYFVGVGGYLGVTGNATYVAYYVIPVVWLPAYLGFSVEAAVKGYVGGTKDISQYLEDSSFSAGDLLASSEDVDLNDNMEFTLNGDAYLTATGFAGIGVCNVIGFRLNLGLTFDVSYVSMMSQWYENLDDNWGFSAELALGGQADLLFTSVPFNGLSVPLTDLGYNEYFTALARAEKMVRIVDHSGVNLRSSDSAIVELAKRYDTVVADLESRSATTSKMKSDAYALYEYLYDHSDLVDKWSSTIALIYYTDSDIYSLLSDDSEETEFTIKEPVDSTWLGDQVTLSAGYEETATDKLLENGYDNPETQLVSLDDGRMAMFFLADPSTLADSSFCAEGQTSILAYTIYDGASWSQPKAVTESGTNDYYPSVVSCGDQLMINWVSTADGSENAGTDATKAEVIDQFNQMEIFSTMYNIADDSFSAVTQLTDDDEMDIYPQGVYDSTTGQCAVYYIKTAPDTEAEVDDLSLTDFFNTYSDVTYSMICYRLYDGESGSWVVDYYDSEVPASYTGDREAYAKELGEAENGQRYLPSVLELLQEQGLADADADGMTYTYETYENGETVTVSEYIDPPISDLDVCEGYNGLAVYAYTVDMDQNLSTSEDTELFIQVYDFWNHKTYHPIRLTDDEVADARPQLVRSGDSTYLFWLTADSTIKYVDVSEMIRDYVDADGQIVDTYYVDKDDNYYYVDDNGIYSIGDDGRNYVAADTTIYYESEEKETFGQIYYLDASGAKVFVSDEDVFAIEGSLAKCTYEFVPAQVTATATDDDEKPTVNDYQAVMDSDQNIYILWTQQVDTDTEDYKDVPANEIFASAMIKGENSAATGWSDPYQLTTSGRQLDGVSGAVNSDGQLFLAYNAYDMEYIGDTEEFIRNAHINEDGTLSGNPYSIGETDLMVTRLNEIGCMKADSVEISDMSPVADETVSVTAEIRNAGLTSAVQGYTASFYAVDSSGSRTLIQTVTDSTAAAPGETRTVTFEWTVPENFVDMKLAAVVTETGYENTNETFSDTLCYAPAYEIDVQNVVQQGDSFVATYTITNTGNAATRTGDRIELRFDGLYQSCEKYGLDTDLLSTVEMENLQPGASGTFTTTFTVPMVAFDYIGYDQLDVYVLSQDDDVYCAGCDDLTLRDPVNMTVNGGYDLNIGKGDTEQVTVDLGNKWISRLNTITYTIADPGIATVDENGVLTAVAEGTTALTVTVMPAGTQKTINVTVGSTSFTDVHTDAYYYNAVMWAAANKVTYGTTATTFSPDESCTRAQMVSFLWRAAGSPEPTATTTPFVDVRSDTYYYKAVLWAYEKGITAGTDATHFSPNEVVTRAQAVSFLYRYAAPDVPTSKDMPFTDVKEGSYYFNAVQWAAKYGVTYGTDATHFSPDETVTRAQSVSFLFRYMMQK